MKVVWAIISAEDAAATIAELYSNKFQVTKISSTGGFLKVGNITLMLGVDDDKVDDVINIISKNCKVRIKNTSPGSLLLGLSSMNDDSMYNVNVGGATVFVTDVCRFEKL